MSLWQLIMLREILVRNIVFPYVNKKVADGHSRTKRFLLQYIFCAILAITLGIYYHQIYFNITALIVFFIGVFNAIGAYCQWKAHAVSLSKTSLFTFWGTTLLL